MKLPNLKSTKSIYLIAIILFGIWMLFFDNNSFLIHNELNQEIKKLKTEKSYYLKEIQKDKSELNQLNSNKGIEKLAREAYYMKRENEDIYIIEYADSLNAKKNEN